MLTQKFVDAALLFEHLLTLPWLTKRSARHEYFMSEHPIKYSYGNDIEYESNSFTAPVLEVLHKVNATLNTQLNACFLNKYDNQQQHLGWHADDFEGMDVNSPIAVISTGAEREIWVRENGYKGEVPQHNKYLLTAGSLFVMPVGFQATHQHRIPKHSAPCGVRISLTFRRFNPC